MFSLFFLLLSTKNLNSAPGCVFFNHSQGLWRWLKGSNMNLDVIMPCLGMWVNWWGLVYSSRGYILVWGHQPHESFPFYPPDYLDDLSQGHATLKTVFFRMENRKEHETLAHLSLSHTQNSFFLIYGSPWQQFAICSWCLNLCLLAKHKPQACTSKTCWAHDKRIVINKDITLKW